MRENVGGADRVMRAVVGPAMIAAGYARFGGNRGRLLGIATIVAGALVTETVITQVCPVSRVLGIDTHR